MSQHLTISSSDAKVKEHQRNHRHLAVPHLPQYTSPCDLTCIGHGRDGNNKAVRGRQR